MYGHYRNSGIPRLHSYADALERFNNTKPIRGRTDVSKPMYPLGHRNKVDSFWMMKCPLTQDVECYLYRTPVVTFKANGEVHIKSDGWISISTANFIGEVLGGVSSYIHDHSLCVNFFSEEGLVVYRVPIGGALVLRKEGRWQYVSGAPNNVTHRVNRKAVNAIRKQYQDFKRYAISMIKLREGMFDFEELKTMFGDTFPANFRYTWNYAEAVKSITNTKVWMSDTSEDKHNQFYKALLSFVRSYGNFASTSLEAFEAGFNDFTLGVHRDEVLIEEILPMGVIKKDNYGRFYRKAWSKYHVEKPEAFALGEKYESEG